MKIISHRGNLAGPNLINENTHDYIDIALKKGFDVEIDLWKINQKYFLGHDKPEKQVELSWLEERKKYLWIHTKNIRSFESLIKLDNGFIFFYYSKEPIVLVSNGIIWTHEPKQIKVYKLCIIPLINKDEIIENENYKWHGICTDYPELLKEKINDL